MHTRWYIILYALIDVTHGTNAYRFKLIAVMIADDYGQGKHHCIVIKVTHLICRIPNGMSQETSKVEAIKELSPDVEFHTLMIDDGKQYNS